MRAALSSLLILALLIISIPALSQPCSMEGIYKIGPSGNFPTLTAALDTLRAKGVANNVILELQTTYSGGGEIYPLRFKKIPCIDSLKNLTIRPEAGATNKIFSSNNGTATIDLDSARFIKFDGRPGGVGTTSVLTIRNTSGIGTAIRFVNDASWNSIEYITIQGVNTSVSSGVIVFGTSNSNISNGNSYNTISNCTISKGASNPAKCIYSAGSSNKKNSYNQIVNCNISDFYSASGETHGISLGANNTNWKISGNSIFHSVQVNFIYSLTVPLYINDTTSSGFIIENNFIGGSAPNCGSGRIIYGSWYNSMWLMTGTASYTSVQNNTIANIGLKKDISAGFMSGITLGAGKFKCGDVQGNTIGSETIPNSINIEVNDDFSFFGIIAGTDDHTSTGVDSCYIRNNKVCGINAFNPVYNGRHGPIIGIYLSYQKKGYADISDNSIGNALSTIGITNNSNPNGNSITGIFAQTHNSVPVALQPQNNISNNVICNLAGKSIGILVSGKYKVLNNVIQKFYAYHDPNGAGANLKGIFAQSGSEGTIISGNIIHSLTCSSTSTNAIIGIEVPNSPGCTISKNFIHSFQTITAAGNDLTGISVIGASGQKIMNNMIRLGIDTLGNTVSVNQKIFGLFLSADSAFTVNNTIYIGGSGTNQTASLIAVTNRPGTIMNNIIVNNRSATGGSTNNQYAIRFDHLTPNLSFVNHNNYYAAGTRGYLGLYKGIGYSSIISWRTATKADSNGFYYNPNLINPNGDRSTVNLHVANPTPIEGQGVFLSEVVDDVDGEVRAGLSPTDIGADAGNFILQDGDAPILSHDLFLGQPVISSFVYTLKITDNGAGVDTNGINKPKMWFRKKFPTPGNWLSNPGNLISGNIKNGTWGFTFDFASSGLTLNPGDSLEYYFVAQDAGLLPNLGYSNLNGTSHSNVNTQTTAPTNPLRLLIYGIFPDTVYVGVGQTYTSLTNSGGYFEAAARNMIDTTHTNVAVIITSDLLNETGTFTYRNLNNSGPVINFRTNTPVEKVIKNATNLNVPMIRIYNTRNVSFDGSIDGNGKYFRFINGNTTASLATSVIEVGGSSYNLSIKNCVFESNSTYSASATVFIASGSKKNVRIESNIIRNIEPGSTSPAGLPNINMRIGGNGSDSLFIKNNDIINFQVTGIVFSGQDSSGRVFIDSNHFYHNSSFAAVGSRVVIDVDASLRVGSITNNFIGGTSRFCAGSPWTFTTTAANYFYGMKIYTDNDTTRPLSIQGNTIQNLKFPTTTYDFWGIYGSHGSMNIGTIHGNLIGSLSNDTSINNQKTSIGIGGYIAIFTNEYPLIRIENNTIAGFHSNYWCGIDFETRRIIVKGNLITKNRCINSGYQGMRIWAERGIIERNIISDLKKISTTSGLVVGISALHTVSSNEVLISRNKIVNLESLSGGGIYGISTGSGRYYIQNNQINITNGNNTHAQSIVGINLTGYGGTTRLTRLYYNSIRIGGQDQSASVKSYAVMVNQNFPIAAFRNNILYNDRTGGSGLNLAVGSISGPNPPISSWPAGSSTNNLFVVPDTNFVNEWRTLGAVNMNLWRSTTQGDTASYVMLASDIPADTLFIFPNQGDLNINALSSRSWAVNGKGIPIASISADYDIDSNIRSTSVATGATDIGSDEFNTSTNPPAMIVSGSHVPGGTEFLSIGGRIIANIVWGSAGSLPTLGETRFYSGTWPNDQTNNNTVSGARSFNSYLDIPASGGSNYSYNLTLHYDSSMLGKVTNTANMKVNKRQSNTPGSWTVIEPTVVNNVLKTVTVSNQSSFSEFTVTDSSATFVSGSPLPDLVVTTNSVNPSSVPTGTVFTAQFIEENHGALSAGVHQVNFYLSIDNVLTPGLNGDTLLGTLSISNILLANSNTGILTKQLTVPCNLSVGNYYLIFVADGLNAVFESNENNNTVFSPMTVTQGISAPQAPSITATPSAMVCAPATVTLTANSAGCNSCTYSWNSGPNGASITVSSSGIYNVIATNACGSSSADQIVTINMIPLQPLPISGNNAVCQGSSQTYSVTAVAGATSYTWTLPTGWGGSSTTNSITVTAGSTGGTISVKANNNCGSSSDQTLLVTVQTLPSQPGSISGNNSVCQGSSQTYSVSPVTGATSYTWTLPAGWTGTSTTNSITVTAGSTSGAVSVKSNNSCGNSSDQSLSVTVNALPSQPGSISGNNSVCQGSSQTYSVSVVNGATSYTWTLPAAWSGTSTSNSITVTAGSASGTVSVKANNSCGSSTDQTLPVTVSTLPAQPASIGGNNSVCQGSSQTYSVSAVAGAISYTWTLPVGWTGASTTNSITVTAGSAGGTVSVKANNSCGSSSDQTLSVTVNTLPSQPGSISGNNSVCQGSSQTYSVTAVAGAASYTWTLPAAWTGTSTSNSITVTAGASGGTIGVKANNSCGSGAEQSLAVTVNPIPGQPTITGNANVLLAQTVTYSVSSLPFATGYNWLVGSGATIQSGQNTNTISVYWASAGTYNIAVNGINVCGNGPLDTLSVTVSVGTAVFNPDNRYELKITPNPSPGDFYLTAKGVSGKKIRISIFNNLGQIVYQSEQTAFINDFSDLLDLKKQSNGFYHVRIYIDDKRYSRKILKRD